MIEAGLAPPTLPSRRQMWLVGGMILVLATAVRCLYLDKSLWCDEADSYIHATAADFAASARLNVHPPLYFLLLRGAEGLIHSFAGLRILSVVCGIATIALLLRTVPAPAAWLAGLLAACSPELVYQSQELRQYALLNLLLLIALLCTLRLSREPDSRGAAIGLATSLAAGAATHLTTGFFMVPLALTLGWSHRREFRRLVGLAALFVPAALLLFFFNRIFLDSARNLGADNWWMAPATWGEVGRAFKVATGWDALHWAAKALGRHVPFGETALLGAMAACAGFTLWTVWFPRPSRLAITLLAIALVYWGAIIVYSFAALSVLMPRILMPGMLPLILSVAIGVAEQRRAGRRRVAGLAISAYALVGITPWLWFFAWVPREDLRGLIDVVRQHRRADDIVVFVGGTDVAVDVYWPEFKQSPRMVKISLLDPMPQQLDALRDALAKRPQVGDVLIVYRIDGYFYPRKNKFETVLDVLSAEGAGSPKAIWEHNFYHVVQMPAARTQ